MGEQPIAVLGVWQPMLPTDWGPPLSGVLARMSDSRVRQYWDPEHFFARQLKTDARTPQPEPDCCDRNGILWDLAAVYPRGVKWDDRLPPATFVNGPVAHVDNELRQAIEAALK